MTTPQTHSQIRRKVVEEIEAISTDASGAFDRDIFHANLEAVGQKLIEAAQKGRAEVHEALQSYINQNREAVKKHIEAELAAK